MHVLTVVGARPQFIKASVVSREIAKFTDIKETLVHTGQHFDANMSDVFFKEMDIPEPGFHLGVAGLGHGAMTGQMLEKLEEIFLRVSPSLVLVYGDTNSTLAGALAAAKLHIPVAHVEAGLRSFNMRMPEEVNRILTDRLSAHLFCPTDTAVQNLTEEGYENFKDVEILKVGDVMYDSVLYYSKKKAENSLIGDLGERIILCTIHRAENTDDPQRLKSIFSGLRQIADQIEVVLPLHPRTRKLITKYQIELGKVKVIEPVGYFEMLELLRRSEVVVTDSGGLQKEAYFFDKPCITLRDETEWTELVQVGHNELVGADEKKFLSALQRAFNSEKTWVKTLYGDGDAGSKIVSKLRSLGST